MPWSELLELVGPYYPKGTRGRPPIGLERMLRVYFLQQCNSVSDAGVEDAITDSQALQAFAGIARPREVVPDATTVFQFRYRAEDHGLTKNLYEAINGQLSAAGLLMREGTIAEATIIAAPPLVKNEAKARDPDMLQSRRRTQWSFRMKAQIGVDTESGEVHALARTAVNVGDATQTEPLLLHAEQKDVILDSGYVSVGKREALKDLEVIWVHRLERQSQCGLGSESVGVVAAPTGIPDSKQGLQRRAALPHCEKSVPPTEGALLGLGQEHGATANAVFPGQPDVCQAAIIGTRWTSCVLKRTKGQKLSTEKAGEPQQLQLNG